MQRAPFNRIDPKHQRDAAKFFTQEEPKSAAWKWILFKPCYQAAVAKTTGPVFPLRFKRDNDAYPNGARWAFLRELLSGLHNRNRALLQNTTGGQYIDHVTSI